MTSRKRTVRSDLSAGQLLHRASQGAAGLFHFLASEYDLTARQFEVLLAISEKEGSSQIELVEKTGIDRSTMADVTQRLLRKGLLQRRRAKHDGRAYSVRLTALGKHFVKVGRPIAEAVDRHVLSALSGPRASDLIDSLALIIRSLDAALGARKG